MEGLLVDVEHRDGLAEAGPDAVVVDAGRHHEDQHLVGCDLGRGDDFELHCCLRTSLPFATDRPGVHVFGDMEVGRNFPDSVEVFHFTLRCAVCHVEPLPPLRAFMLCFAVRVCTGARQAGITLSKSRTDCKQTCCTAIRKPKAVRQGSPVSRLRAEICAPETPEGSGDSCAMERHDDVACCAGAERADVNPAPEPMTAGREMAMCGFWAAVTVDKPPCGRQTVVRDFGSQLAGGIK